MSIEPLVARSDGVAPDPVRELVTADDVQPLREWLRGLGVDVDAVENLPKWNAEAFDGPRRYSDVLAGLRPRVDGTLRAALASVRSTPGGVGRLLVYVHFSCDQAWEVSYHFDPMWATLAALRPLWNEMVAAGAGVDMAVADIATVEAVLFLVDNLHTEIESENAMNAGRLRECERLSELAGRYAAAAADRARTALDGGSPDDNGSLNDSGSPDDNTDPTAEVARYVVEWSQVNVVTDEAARRAAQGVSRFLTDPRFQPTETIEALAACEAELVDIYNDDDAQADPDADTLRKLLGSEDWSEVRANRFSLMALAEARADPARAWLYLDEARIVYLYPFALTGVRVDDDFHRGVTAAAATWTLAGVAPADVHTSFTLDDVWDSTDPAGRRFDGVRVCLPQVVLRDRTGSGAEVAVLDAEIRLSRLGNHYLRFEGDLHDRDPQQVYAALGRAAPEHGSLLVGFAPSGEPAGRHADPGVWPRLAALAVDIVSDLSAELAAPAIVRPGMFQVLLTVSAGSLRAGPDPVAARREVRGLDDVRTAFGAGVLFNPVSHVMTSFAEWSRYPVRPEMGVSGLTNLSDHVTVRTRNTTVHLGWGLPLWALSTAGTVSEFAASLEGLFAGWFEELESYRRQVAARRDDERPDESADVLRERVNGLRELRAGLLDLVSGFRSTVSLINSPALMRSPTVALGLATMVTASGFHDRVRQLNERVDEVLSDRLEADIDRLLKRCEESERKLESQRKEHQEHLERRQRRRLDTMLAVIAAVGVSGLGQILQSGYGMGVFGSLQVMAAIVVLALVVGLWAWYTSRHPGGAGQAPTETLGAGKDGTARASGRRRQRDHA